MTLAPTRSPVALTVAGSDSGGGAGIQADLKSFSALGVYGASVVTAVTAQNTREVTAVHDIPPAMIRAQLDAVFADIEVDAVKVGMVATTAAIEAVADGLAGRSIPLVVDPVMVAKSGDALLQPEAMEALRRRLIPAATIITPNLPEAARLLDEEPAEDIPAMYRQALRLQELGASAVLMKGGHGRGPLCVDLLVDAGGGSTRLASPRVDTRNTHGTGCSLSSAIAAGLACGLPLAEAVDRAHLWLHRAILAADALGVGGGHGPVHHFHASWGAR